MRHLCVLLIAMLGVGGMACQVPKKTTKGFEDVFSAHPEQAVLGDHFVELTRDNMKRIDAAFDESLTPEVDRESYLEAIRAAHTTIGEFEIWINLTQYTLAIELKEDGVTHPVIQNWDGCWESINAALDAKVAPAWMPACQMVVPAVPKRKPPAKNLAPPNTKKRKVEVVPGTRAT